MIVACDSSASFSYLNSNLSDFTSYFHFLKYFLYDISVVCNCSLAETFASLYSSCLDKKSLKISDRVPQICKTILQGSWNWPSKYLNQHVSIFWIWCSNGENESKCFMILGQTIKDIIQVGYINVCISKSMWELKV
jgi:hypothetical protein